MNNRKEVVGYSSREVFWRALIGGLVAVGILFVACRLTGLPYPPELIFQLTIAPVPGSIQSVAVEMFREYAKYGAFAFSAGIYALIYACTVTLVVRHRSDLRGSIKLLMIVTTLALSAMALFFTGILASRVSVLSSLQGWAVATLLLTTLNLGYSALVLAWVSGTIGRGQWEVGNMSSRRGFLKRALLFIVGIAIAAGAGQFGISLLLGRPVVGSQTSIPVNDPPDAVDLLQLAPVFRDPRIRDLVGSEVTDNRVFYRVDINPVPLQLDFDRWSLRVHGQVERPFTLDGNMLLRLPTKEQYATLECVSNTINPPGALISNAKWIGIPLAEILNRAGMRQEAKYVVFRCADGYSVGIPVDRAMGTGALLAYKMNDELLPNEHGFPLRAIVPGIYGMMNAKWITEIEVTDRVYLGYWQERGWSNDAQIKTTSIIYYPAPQAQINGPLPIAGVAFAGDRGISKVEVSTDGGETWNSATLKEPRSPYSWVLWAYEWTPSTQGRHRLLSRATDGNGQLQDAAPRSSYPDGATGYHEIEVIVS